ncbi:hypothetical protein [Nostoc sp. FACHB-888]|uniref:hypothetical protein n=1 Tax=Nostoc sp. FACHB-888 TaxID=2692842 RepID=UPI0016834756|nr:hypothetical protein [Nostoc sp. FACHB-888]MBD2246480.1 hypothetical protein [Nostoc sp. FACHB-888]
MKISEIPEFVKLLSEKIHKAHYVDKELKKLSKSLDKGELESRTTIININIFINESKSTSHEIKEILSGKVDYTKLQEALGTANY